MATYYVAKTGSDENPGTLRHPFLTVAEGLHSLDGGDLLYILGGTYEEDFVFINTARASEPVNIWLKSPRISAYPGESVILTSPTESKTIAYFSLQGFAAVQEPSNYAGVTLINITNQRDSGEGKVNAFAFVVGGFEYITSLPADIVRPTVTITFPVDNATVSGSVVVEAAGTDNVEIESMWLKLDGETVHSEYPESDCEFTWDTTLSLNGDHVLVAWGKDAAGNVGASAPISVVVDNVPPIQISDNSLMIPSITVTSPSGGELWRSGDVVNITWSSLGIEGNLDVYFIRDGLSHQIFENVPNTGTISWTIAGNRGPHCQIRLNSINNPVIFGNSASFNLV